MRTTLTLDDDVASMLENLRNRREVSLKRAVNDLLREALLGTHKKASARPQYRMATADLGSCLVDGLDDIAGVLAEAEGDAYV